MPSRSQCRSLSKTAAPGTSASWSTEDMDTKGLAAARRAFTSMQAGGNSKSWMLLQDPSMPRSCFWTDARDQLAEKSQLTDEAICSSTPSSPVESAAQNDANAVTLVRANERLPRPATVSPAATMSRQNVSKSPISPGPQARSQATVGRRRRDIWCRCFGEPVKVQQAFGSRPVSA